MHLAFLLALTAACGSSAPPPDPLTMMHAGVDPNSEADAVSAVLERSGYARTARVSGRALTAMAFRRAADGATAVRLVTWRGLALALDAVPGQEGFESLRLPFDHVMEIGSAETLVIEGRSRTRGVCLELVRAMDDGFVRGLRLDLPAGLAGCVVTASDEEILARAGILGEHYGDAPELSVLLAAEGDALRVAAQATEFWREERARREAELAVLRRARDVDSAIRVALELAWIERLVGNPLADQLVTFDRALNGLVLSEAQADAIRVARASLAR